MESILHLSDLHFGTERPGLVEEVVNTIQKLQPNIVVISGDLTQRAKFSQFQQAKDFIKKLALEKVVCVPGNHDIALYNPIERFLYPFYKYNKFIHSTPCAAYRDDKLIIFGINSVTPYKPMGGYVTQEQLNKTKAFFKNIPDDMIKIVVMHHNLIYSERHKIINDSEKIINILSECRVNLVLAGHIHMPLIEQLKRSYFSHNMYVITAGTAISHRTSAPNSFNLINIEDKTFTLSIYEFNGREFVISQQKTFLL